MQMLYISFSRSFLPSSDSTMSSALVTVATWTGDSALEKVQDGL